jgi:ceramide glucosyltransferase
MSTPHPLVWAALLPWIVGSIAFPVVGLLALWTWRREGAARPAFRGELPPVTLLRPLKSGVPALREKLALLAEALRPGDQLVLGVEAGTEEERAGHEVRAAFPGREILVIPCAPGKAFNPKISKLIQMTPHARHDHWILSDSEAVIDLAWLTAFREEWQSRGADVLTTGYRFIHQSGWFQRLDAAGILLALWPGLAVMRHEGKIAFTLGACTGFRRADIEQIGGWATFGDLLAEDNRLGAALVEAGRTIRLSSQVATLESDPLTWRAYWRHQRRVAVTYRVCHPAGFAGTVFVNGFAGLVASALVALQLPSSVPALALLLGVLALQGLRWACFRGMAGWLRFPAPWLFPVMLAASAIEFACWCAAWLDRRVWWAGRQWHVSLDGRLVPPA